MAKVAVKTIVKEVVQALTTEKNCKVVTEADPANTISEKFNNWRVIKPILRVEDSPQEEIRILEEIMILEEITIPEEIMNPEEEKNQIEIEKRTITDKIKTTTREVYLIIKTLGMVIDTEIGIRKKKILVIKSIPEENIEKGLALEKMKGGEDMEIEVDLHILKNKERKRVNKMIKWIEIMIGEKKMKGLKKATENGRNHLHKITEMMIKKTVNKIELIKEATKKETVTGMIRILRIKNMLQKPKKTKISQIPRLRNAKKVMFLMIKLAKIWAKALSRKWLLVLKMGKTLKLEGNWGILSLEPMSKRTLEKLLTKSKSKGLLKSLNRIIKQMITKVKTKLEDNENNSMKLIQL
jgi:hypothetical protein